MKTATQVKDMADEFNTINSKYKSELDRVSYWIEAAAKRGKYTVSVAGVDVSMLPYITTELESSGYVILSPTQSEVDSGASESYTLSVSWVEPVVPPVEDEPLPQ